jgi:metal-responsive CopG/Arc/MetJ family transcriptional regulator
MEEITVQLPDNVSSALDEATREAGLSRNEIIEKALSDYLFIRRFRLLRERLASESENVYTDQDVFDSVS